MGSNFGSFFSTFSDAFQSVLAIVFTILLNGFLIYNAFLLYKYYRDGKLKKRRAKLFDETKVSIAGLLFNLA